MRLFQVQTVHFDEIKERIHGPLFCEIEALYLMPLFYKPKDLIWALLFHKNRHFVFETASYRAL